MVFLFRRGWQYQIKGDINLAIEYYTLAKEEGHNGAALHLSNMYKYGIGVAVDTNKSIMYDTIPVSDEEFEEIRECYREREGDVAIQQCICNLYYFVRKDYEESFKWSMKGVEQGNADSMCDIGIMYTKGEGREVDYEEAYKWYKLAAEKGNADAQYCIGTAYYNGWGVPQDYTQAYTWWVLAAENKNRDGATDLGYMYLNGTGVEKDLSKAHTWFQLATKLNGRDAQYALGSLYKRGGGVESNHQEAYKWYKLGAQNGQLSCIKKIKKFTELKYRIGNHLSLYTQSHENEGKSYLLFANFLKYLIEQEGSLNWNDPLYRKWISKYFMIYVTKFNRRMVENWFNSIYG